LTWLTRNKEIKQEDEPWGTRSWLASAWLVGQVLQGTHIKHAPRDRYLLQPREARTTRHVPCFLARDVRKINSTIDRSERSVDPTGLARPHVGRIPLFFFFFSFFLFFFLQLFCFFTRYVHNSMYKKKVMRTTRCLQKQLFTQFVVSEKIYTQVIF
jgi:hypothetical protein